MSTELDRLNELRKKLNSSNLLTTEEQQEYNNLFDKLYSVGEQESEDDTAGFSEKQSKLHKICSLVLLLGQKLLVNILV